MSEAQNTQRPLQILVLGDSISWGQGLYFGLGAIAVNGVKPDAVASLIANLRTSEIHAYSELEGARPARSEHSSRGLDS